MIEFLPGWSVTCIWWTWGVAAIVGCGIAALGVLALLGAILISFITAMLEF